MHIFFLFLLRFIIMVIIQYIALYESVSSLICYCVLL